MKLLPLPSNRPHPHARSSRKSAAAASSTAFTLIELMVVIVIIGILAGVAVPSSMRIIANAKKQVAFNGANQLKMVISSYFTEYRKYPTRDTRPDDSNRPQFSDHVLIDILIPSDKEAAPGGMNPRRHAGLGFNNAQPMRGGKYRGGVVLEEDGSGELWDPYGNYYRVVMDTNYDHRIPAPAFDDDSKAIMQSVIVWSPGDDDDDSTIKDNVMTWRP